MTKFKGKSLGQHSFFVSHKPLFSPVAIYVYGDRFL